MHIQPTQIIYPNWKRINSIENFFDAVKSNFDAYQQQENFHWCSKEAIYLMRIETSAQIFNGIACGVLVENYWNGNIKGHEATISAKEEKQLELLQERKAQVKPVLLTYPSVQAIENWIASYQAQEAPLYEIQKNGNWYIVWQVAQKQSLQRFQELFAQYVSTLYIADGHHRTRVTARLAQYLDKSLMIYAALFSSAQIKITAFHRVIEGIKGRTVAAFFDAIAKVCYIQEVSTWNLSPPKHHLQMYALGKLYSLTWKPEILTSSGTNQAAALDAALLDKYIIQEVMQIKDVRESDQISYIAGDTGSVESICKLVDKDKDRVGFFLPSIQVEEFMSVVNAGVILPPKSTYFEPRMLNGLLVYQWE